MPIDIRDDRRYTESHEWALEVNGTVRIGISDFAQDELGDIVYVELPETGDEIATGDPFGVIESIKAVSDLYAPIAGEVVDRNDDLFDTPELVNESPYDDGWLIEVDPHAEDALDALMSHEEYETQVA